MAKITIGLCDRQTLIRDALAQLLHTEQDFEVVWSVPSLTGLLDGDMIVTPDVLLIDFTSASPPLINEVKEFRGWHTETQIVAMTDHGQDTCVLFQEQPPTFGLMQPKTCCIQQAFMLGARGAVRRTSPREELVRVIRAVMNRQIAVAEPSLSLLLARIFGPPHPETPQPHLTDRELEVIRALALGKSNKEIATVLGIREQTVKNHISHILEKLALEDRLQIVVFAARNNLVNLDDR